ncbi:MAG: rod shape-determining protein MreC [Candidatus Marinimicrobia bacterium]|nr:rod shape-determining protein MreC [Candidatus Neomarinimicrobiota bacterium]
MLVKLLVLIQKNRHHFTFMLFVIISFILIYNSDSNKFKLQFLNNITSYLSSPFTRFNLLSKAAQENEILRERLMVLSLEKETLLKYEVENVNLKEMLDFKRESEIKMIPTTVVNMGLTSNILSMTVDVGSEMGVSINNPVITPNGIIGKISTVNSNSSIVQLISDPSFRIGVRLLPSNATGILRWRINNICDVREVYKNSTISVGDRVVTSGLSDIFPKGLPVGIVSSVTNDRSQFQKIVSVKIEENLSSIIHVFIIINENPIQ